MSEGLPEQVDAVRLAARGARIRNVTPVAAMTRLAGQLADATGRVDSDLKFSQESRRIRIDGGASATVQVTCQRCLEAMAVALDVGIAVAVVDSDAEAEALPEGVEGVSGDDGRVSPLEVVEDELILALPIVALHAAGECRAPAEAAPRATGRVSPFAVLETLKTDNDSSRSRTDGSPKKP